MKKKCSLFAQGFLLATLIISHIIHIVRETAILVQKIWPKKGAPIRNISA